MKLNVRRIYISGTYVIVALFFASGCTKKVPTVNPDKIRGSALQDKLKKEADEAAAAQVPTDKLPEPAPEDSHPSPIAIPAPVLTPKPKLEPVPPAQASTPEPELSPVATTPAPAPKPAPTPISIFENCVHEKSVAVIGVLEKSSASAIKPSQLSAARKAIAEACLAKFEDKKVKSELEKFNIVIVLVDEALKRFPRHDDSIKFFKAIEDNATYTRDQKDRIYSVYGSGGEIETSGIQFFGKLEKVKSSSNVISYRVTSAIGSWATRIFFSEGQIGKNKTLDLKTVTNPNIRFTFDFSANQKGSYLLMISDGTTKVVANVIFKLGDLKALRDGKQVTVTLTSDAWYKVQEAHLRNLIADQAKDLMSMPFALDRRQKDLNLVRTCNLKEESIACTDPDYSISALVKIATTPSK